MGFDFADNHGVENLVSSVLGDIHKLDEAGGVCAFHALVLWAFWASYNPLAVAAKFIGVGGVRNVRILWVFSQLGVW